MRIIFLNSWYGQTKNKYFDFVKKYSAQTDIFGLLEIHPKLFRGLDKLLPNFRGEYISSIYDISMGYIYGQALFVKKGIPLKKLCKISLFRNTHNDIGYATAFEVNLKNKLFTLVLVHGKARPGHKLDTPARIRQSMKIIDFLATRSGPKIVGGDFNLLPQTLSVRMFEKRGYLNLIKKFGIKSTRNKLCWDQFPDDVKKNGKQYFADYCFVSPDIKVISFEVPKVEVSDHEPLILDFEI